MSKLRPILIVIASMALLFGLYQNCAETMDLSEYTQSSSGQGGDDSDNNNGNGGAGGQAPLFTMAPQNISATLLAPINVSVAVSDPAATFAWYKNNVSLNNATSSLQIASAQESDAGSYRVIAQNAYGTAEAIFAIVVTRLPNQVAPTIATPVNNLTGTHIFLNGVPGNLFITGRSAEPFNLATFSVIATSAYPLRYQWYRVTQSGDAIIPGATAATYSFQAQSVLNSGTYKVVVSNDFGSVMSQGTLTITQQNVTFPQF